MRWPYFRLLSMGAGNIPTLPHRNPPPHAPVERVEALFPVKCSGVCDVSGPFSSFTGPALSSVMRVWERAKSKRGDGPTQSPIMWKETYKCMCVCVYKQIHKHEHTPFGPGTWSHIKELICLQAASTSLRYTDNSALQGGGGQDVVAAHNDQ